MRAQWGALPLRPCELRRSPKDDLRRANPVHVGLVPLDSVVKMKKGACSNRPVITRTSPEATPASRIFVPNAIRSRYREF